MHFLYNENSFISVLKFAALYSITFSHEVFCTIHGSCSYLGSRIQVQVVEIERVENMVGNMG